MDAIKKNSPKHENSCPKLKQFKRGRSLIGPVPVFNFGPKASSTHQQVSRNFLHDPYDQKLKWHCPPENVLVVKRDDSSTNKSFKTLVSWLVVEKHLNVFVEEKVVSHPALKNDEEFALIHSQLHSDYNTKEIDLVVCLGGDGTLLYTVSLFQKSMPPLIAFHSGSLGFLTAHRFENYQETITKALNGDAILMLRSRLRCIVERAGNGALKNGDVNGDSADIRSNSSSDSIVEEGQCSFLVLNEVVVNRGSSHYLCNVDLYLEGRRITSVQGDGLIISTPTGSTAYAVAAGASIVHPNVPSIMITPICPHSLSFRPIIVPPGAELKFTVAENARGTASVCFDGRSSVIIKQGDYVTVRTSVHPAPCICKENPFDDWFDSLSECLHWNSRQIQKKLETSDDSEVAM